MAVSNLIFPPSTSIIKVAQPEPIPYYLTFYLHKRQNEVNLCFEAFHIRSLENQNVLIKINNVSRETLLQNGLNVIDIGFVFSSKDFDRVRIEITFEKSFFVFGFNGGEPCGSCGREVEAFALWNEYRKWFSWVETSLIGSPINVLYSVLKNNCK